MDIRVFETDAEVAAAVAGRVAEAIRARPTLVLGLAAGGTPVATYAELRARFAAGQVDFSHVTTFNIDEFAGIEPSHPGSFRQFMQVHFFSGVNIDPHRIHFLDGSAADLEVECDRYEKAIENAGGIDLQLLGIGTNGHIGFNEPGPALVARTHRVRLHAITRRENAALFSGDVSRVPREALTMGVGTIFRARAIAVVATGQRKAAAVARAVLGPITTHVPASLLQLHGRVELYLDRAAASRL